ncbi:MAG: hypothetical protein WCO00_07725 [Rhodospirillaceae bacterium]
MIFPFAIMAADASLRVVRGAEAFIGPDGTQHPAGALNVWSAADLESLCPGWRVLPLVEPPAPALPVIGETAALTADGAAVAVTWLTAPPPGAGEAAAALARARAEACQRVDAEAEALRARFLTPGSGQAMSYLIKAQEARAVLAGGGAAPILTALLGIELDPATGAPAASLERLAAIVDAEAGRWQAAEAGIDAARRGAKIRIAAAPGPAEVAALFPVAWPG